MKKNSEDFINIKKDNTMSSFMTKLRAKMLSNIDDLPLKEKIVEKRKCKIVCLIINIREAINEKRIRAVN
jgi:hypothetical protein